MFFQAFFIFLIFILVAAAFLKLSFMISVSIDGDGFYMDIRVMFYKILTLYNWNYKEGGSSFLLKRKKKVDDKLKKKKSRISAIIKIIFSSDTFRHLKKDMQKFDITVKGRIATDNAASTAMLYGGVWSVLGVLIPYIPQKRLILDFYPDFNKDISDFHISCILRVKIIHIIVLMAEHKRKQ